MAKHFADESRAAYLDKVLHDALIEVLSAQMRVSICGKHLKDAVGDGEQGDIESSAAEVEDKDVLLSATLVIQAVSDCCGGGLVDDPVTIESVEHVDHHLKGFQLGEPL